MAISQVGICNAALGKLGQDVRISTMGDQSKAAKALNAAWQRVRDYVLADAVWPFSVKSLALSALVDPVPGWAYAYAYPSDCLNALAVTDEFGLRPLRRLALAGNSVHGADYETQGGEQSQSIATDQKGAWLLYCARVEDVGRFPPLFIEALTCRLALDVAPVIAAELGIRLGPNLEQKYMAAKSNAITAALNESMDRMDFASPTLASRGDA